LFAEGADLLSCVNGWDVSAEELHTIARRIVTAKKLFNIREGWTAAEDTLPKRFLSEGLPDGASSGAVLPAERLQEMIQAYYAARDWDSQGNVPDAVVRELGLTDLYHHCEALAKIPTLTRSVSEEETKETCGH
jgi:aldehyde:ferredoxin oxidoreductase